MDENSKLEGQCATCGLLSRRTGIVDRSYKGESLPNYYEVSGFGRMTGQVYRVRDPNRLNEPAVLACLVGAFEIEAEAMSAQIEAESDEERLQELTLRILNESRRCPRWVEYRPGFSPKEHLVLDSWHRWEGERREWERRLTEQTEGQRRDWDEKMEENRRQWDERMEQNRREWHGELEKRGTEESRKFSKLGHRVNLVGILIALFAAVLTALAATPDSILGGWLFGTEPTLPPAPDEAGTAPLDTMMPSGDN